MHNPYVIHIENEQHLFEEIRQIGLPESEGRLLLPKGRALTVRVDHVSAQTAIVIKGAMPAAHAAGSGSMLLMGTQQQFADLIGILDADPLAGELQALLARHDDRSLRTIQAGAHTLEFGRRTLVMGILNITPDSFSDGGKWWADLDKAVEHARQMIADGADILDIGGESTRPGHAPVSAEEEARRVVPVIERLAREVNVPISIDTYKASVAEAAVRAGAHIVNDVWGFKADRDMAAVCAKLDCPAILMVNRDKPYESDPITGVIRDIRECIALAHQAGVRDENLILDPGIGFGKTQEQNLYVMRRLEDFNRLGYPVLLGTSRKSMIGNALGLPVNERVEGTAATVALGIAKGADIVRVHDVREMTRVARMTDAMVR